MSDRDVLAASEKRERAARRLAKAVAACRDTDLTPDELLLIVRPLFRGDDDIFIEGALFENLGPDAASTVLRIAYEALPANGTLSFAAMHRKSADIYALCDDANIRRDDVTITAEPHALRVVIVKPPS